MPITPTPRPPIVTGDDRAKLGAFLAGASLYATIQITGTWRPQDRIQSVFPAEIQRECESEKCNGFASGWMLMRSEPEEIPCPATVVVSCTSVGTVGLLFMSGSGGNTRRRPAGRASTHSRKSWVR